MDSATKSVLKMLAIGAVKKGLIGFGAFCGGHGIVLGFTATDYAAAAAGIVAAGWSFWQDAGKGIMEDSFEVMRARIPWQSLTPTLKPFVYSSIAEKNQALIAGLTRKLNRAAAAL